jgi:hypothetical protein
VVTVGENRMRRGCGAKAGPTHPKFVRELHQALRFGARCGKAERVCRHAPIERLVDTAHDAIGALPEDILGRSRRPKLLPGSVHDSPAAPPSRGTPIDQSPQGYCFYYRFDRDLCYFGFKNAGNS